MKWIGFVIFVAFGLQMGCGSGGSSDSIAEVRGTIRIAQSPNFLLEGENKGKDEVEQFRASVASDEVVAELAKSLDSVLEGDSAAERQATLKAALTAETGSHQDGMMDLKVALKSKPLSMGTLKLWAEVLDRRAKQVGGNDLVRSSLEDLQADMEKKQLEIVPLEKEAGSFKEITENADAQKWEAFRIEVERLITSNRLAAEKVLAKITEWKKSSSPVSEPELIDQLKSVMVRPEKSGDVPGEEAEGDVADNPAPNPQRLFELQVELESLLTRYGPNHPAVRKIQEEIEQLGSVEKELEEFPLDSGLASPSEEPGVEELRRAITEFLNQATVRYRDAAEKQKLVENQLRTKRNELNVLQLKLENAMNQLAQSSVPLVDFTVLVLPDDEPVTKKEVDDYAEMRRQCPDLPAIEFKLKS